MKSLSINVSKIDEAIEKAKRSTKRNFIQSIDLILLFQDLDLKKPDNRISEFIELPNPPFENIKVCFIGTGHLASEAKKAGADRIISKDELEELGKNKKDARKVVQEYGSFMAEASIMPLVGKTLGSLLGPKGKMPVPTPPNVSLGPIIDRQRKLILIKIRDQPILQCKVGSEKMDNKKIIENVQTIIKSLEGKLARGLKNIKKIQIKASMGEPILIYKIGMKTK